MSSLLSVYASETIKAFYRHVEALKVSLSPNKLLLLTLVVDFFQLELRDRLRTTPCACGSEMDIPTLVHPPQAVDGHIHYFDAPPLRFKVDKSVGFDVMLQKISLSVRDTTVPTHMTEETHRHLRMITVTNVTNDPSGCPSPKKLQYYQITEESMPNRRVLIEWESAYIKEKADLFPEDVESILDAFLLKWCKGPSSNGMVSCISYVSLLPLAHSSG